MTGPDWAMFRGLLAEQETYLAAVVAERDALREQLEVSQRWGRREQGAGDALAAERDALRAALTEIADHTVISEGEFPDDNCDWHCTAEIVALARQALAGEAAPPPGEWTCACPPTKCHELPGCPTYARIHKLGAGTARSSEGSAA